ncbi:MAG: bglA1 [Fibrobacteres bacterium]|nr:bglA1 [Fibrobacterota bacterium]
MGTKNNLPAFLMVTVFGLHQGWSDIIVKLQDAQSKPLAGVSCSQSGGAAAVSDQNGTLTFNDITSIRNPMQGNAGNFSMSRIPLAAGERASVTVVNTQGQKVMQRQISLGDRVEFSSYDKGVFFVNISSRNFSTHGRIANVGGGISFEGVASGSAPAGGALAKTGGAGISITCSKTGFPTQIYQLLNGSTTTINFSKLNLVPLFDQTTKLEPDVIEETPTAIITRFADRGRDRHAREDEFHIYDHYLGHYWIHRTATIEIVDEIAKGGTEVKVNVQTQWKLSSTNCRAFYRGIGTVAEYHANNLMTPDPVVPLLYHTTFKQNPKENFRPIKIGDRMEMEVSQFLDGPPEGRENYYGTVVLYIVGSGGLVPWEPKGVFGDASTEREDSYPVDKAAWEGGRVTLPTQTSNEPLFHFIQMAPNLAPVNGQSFVLGRRVHHTDFLTGEHDEPDNDKFTEMAGKSGPNYVNASCNACHANNGRALPPAVGTVLSNYVMKVGDGNGNPHPLLGSVLQPRTTNGTAEGSVTLSGWTEADGLRKPTYAFSGAAVPTQYSARISPQLVGMGLLEAVPEASIQAMADPDDANGDGISGRMRVVADYDNGLPHLGRFGWKAGKPTVRTQVAGAFNTDMGVTTSVLPDPDCGSAQTNCGTKGAELPDSALQHLVDYISLLGVSLRKDIKDPVALQGEALFTSAGCAACHTTTLVTSAYHPKAELRNQTIHPYTDLLLHDMGAGLADNLPEGDATGAEWRTAPLWNIGYTAGVSGGEAYLHDGRARTLNEAILWHGGEGAKAAANFKAMSAGDAAALVKFLKSL